METKINIAEILKDKPVGIKLYSSTFGYIKFNGVHKDKVYFYSEDTNVHSVKSNGKMYNGGECIIFPSKEMRDWTKFSWKKGDALSCGVDNLCIFEKWANKEYTEFYAKFVTPNYSGNTFKTEKWSKETNEAVIKQYISNIGEFKGGKLNLTTLEIKKKPEFKDGDILSCDEDTYTKHTILILHKNGYVVEALVSLIRHRDIEYSEPINEFLLSRLYYAREDEKKELFDALENEGKRWDAEKKQIVDLKPKWTPKPFDRVITRDDDDDIWVANIFSHIDSHGEYVPIGCVSGYPYCIPYNEETAKLLGTTNDWKG